MTGSKGAKCCPNRRLATPPPLEPGLPIQFRFQEVGRVRARKSVEARLLEAVLVALINAAALIAVAWVGM